jgi:hypothetical protein
MAFLQTNMLNMSILGDKSIRRDAGQLDEDYPQSEQNIYSIFIRRLPVPARDFVRRLLCGPGMEALTKF